jgi:hypothetical protein
MLRLKQMPDYTWQIPFKPGDTAIFGPDQHNAPAGDPNGGVDPAAVSCMAQAIQIVKPNLYGDLGDIGEWSSVSPWNKSRQKRPDMAKTIDALYDDLEAVAAGQDLIDGVLDEVGCKRKIQFQGNHEVWIDNMLGEWREQLGRLMAPDMTTEKLMGLKERGYAYVPYGDYASLGKLNIYHGGHFGGQHHANAHVANLSASVLYAHHHSYQVAKRALLGKGVHAAWCMGFLGKPRKPFMKGRPTNWSHNFAIVHVEKGGRFHMEPVEIFEGVCYVYGRKIVG